MLEHVDTILSFALVMLLLSLLITSLVQIIVALFRQRRVVLKLGIERLLKQIAPGLVADNAAEIAESVLKHPALRTGKGHPTAIQKEELIRLLDDLATSATSSLPGKLQKSLAQAMGVATVPGLAKAADNLTAEIGKRFPTQATVINSLIKRTIVPPRQIVLKVDAWFDTVMNRTTDQFQHRTRGITIVFAVLLAFGFHIDSLKILQRLASDAELRANLTQGADAALRKAEAFLPVVAGSTNPTSVALQQTCKDLAARPAVRLINSVPPGVASPAQAMAWIEKTFTDPNDRQEIRARYEKHLREMAGPELGELIQTSRQIKTTLEGSTLVAFPTPQWKDIYRYWREPTHFWGTLMSAFFLSLGAPFWYNTLRQLSNLRPAIARKIDVAAQPRKP